MSETDKPSGRVVRVAMARLMAKKQADERKLIKLSDVIRGSGVSRTVVYWAADGRLKSLSFADMRKLADYFGVQPGDLFQEVDE